MDQIEVMSRYAGKSETEWNRLTASPIRRIEYMITFHTLEHYLKPSGWVLDVGSGPGRYAIDLALKGHRVFMVDLLLEMLQFGQAKIAEAGIDQRVSPAAGDMMALPLPFEYLRHSDQLGGTPIPYNFGALAEYSSRRNGTCGQTRRNSFPDRTKPVGMLSWSCVLVERPYFFRADYPARLQS